MSLQPGDAEVDLISDGSNDLISDGSGIVTPDQLEPELQEFESAWPQQQQPEPQELEPEPQEPDGARARSAGGSRGARARVGLAAAVARHTADTFQALHSEDQALLSSSPSRFPRAPPEVVLVDES